MLAFVMGDVEAQAWQDRLLQVTETLTKDRKVGRKQTPLSRGELIQRHGKEEALEFIGKGKFLHTKDKWGDDVYIKNEDYVENSGTRSTTLSTSRSLLIASIASITASRISGTGKVRGKVRAGECTVPAAAGPPAVVPG